MNEHLCECVCMHLLGDNAIFWKCYLVSFVLINFLWAFQCLSSVCVLSDSETIIRT